MKASLLLLVVCLFGAALAQECHEPNVDEAGGEALLAADVCAVNEALGKSPPDFVTALSIYEVGENTEEETLEEASTKSFPCPTWQKYEEFFGGPGWMDDIIRNALNGTAPLETDDARVQVVKKVLQGTVLNQHAIYHLERAVIELGEPDAVGALFQWDLAMAAFFGTDVDCAGFGNGVARGLEFGTTVGALAGTNVRIGQEFVAGREAIDEGDVEALSASVEEITRNIVIIYVQSVLKYAVLLSEGEKFDKSQGEGFGYLHAVLPLIAECDEDVANDAVAVFTPGNTPDAEDAEAIVESMAGIYECLNITEEEVGAFRDGDGIDLSEFEPNCYSENPFAGGVSANIAEADG